MQKSIESAIWQRQWVVYCCDGKFLAPSSAGTRSLLLWAPTAPPGGTFPSRYPVVTSRPRYRLPRRLLPPRPERKNHKPVEPRLMFCLKITFGGPWPVPKTSALSGRNFSSALAAAKRLFVPPDTWQELFERVPPPPRGKNTQWEPQAARNKPTDERGM